MEIYAEPLPPNHPTFEGCEGPVFLVTERWLREKAPWTAPEYCRAVCPHQVEVD
jgi:hypothetical protein